MARFLNHHSENSIDPVRPKQLKLLCVIEGSSVVFPVNIYSDAVVGDLKDAIKTKKSRDLRSIDADMLTLCKVSISANSKKRIRARDMSAKDILDPSTEISEVFGAEPPKGTIHVQVEKCIDSVKAKQLELLCVGNWKSKALKTFPVYISPEAIVGDLKDVIEAKRSCELHSVDADRLTLYKVSIPNNPKDPAPLRKLILKEVFQMRVAKLDPSMQISELFGTNPSNGTIYIIYRSPVLRTLFFMAFLTCLADTVCIISSGIQIQYSMTPN
ncbi:hypothetical protein BGZ80_001507 [Entomortierella chlamydospora]|uniref:Crinkler effector protein N-terminal domain-containing protein n=1 Tax=Entomortierella chlamydospora TaxID=101097 RepID=A0A9P6MQQ4_9FUNG|nr:hypothetical protein BGZ80_001507 [Entomortierella chlamydospora]